MTTTTASFSVPVHGPNSMRLAERFAGAARVNLHLREEKRLFGKRMVAVFTGPVTNISILHANLAEAGYV